MPVVSKLQSGFTSGELDPKLRARSDVAAYYDGAAKLRNVLVIPQGAAKRRPGLEYIKDIPTGNVQMIPFVFSDTEHYLCILTTNLLSIYQSGQLIDEVTCTISDAQIPDITWAQSYDTLILFHQEFAPLSFIRESETTWTTPAAPWTLRNIPSRNFGLPATTSVTITDSSSGNIEFDAWVAGNTVTGAFFTTVTPAVTGWKHAFDDPGDIGKYVRAGGGYAKITDVTNVDPILTPTPATAGSSIATCTVLTAFSNDKGASDATVYASGEWGIEEPVWSASRGYPACGTFFQGRLYMANTTNLPNTIWGSIVNNENDFQNWIPEFADNGIEVTAGGGLMSNIHRLHSGQHLIGLADNGEFYIPSSKQQPITPTNVSLVRNSSYGSVNLPTFEIDGAVVFMRSGGKSLIESKFNFADGSYINKDLSLLSSHLLNEPKAISYRKQTNTDEADYVLIVNGDGTLSVLCTLRIQEVTAWTVCETNGSFVSCAVDGSEMYFICDRLIGGIPRRTLERFNDDILLDCADQSYDVSTITNISYLNGQECAIVLDNTVQPSQTVESGQVTLDRHGDYAQIGFEFPIVDEDTGSHVYIELMPIEVDLQDGSSVGKKKRVIEATVMLYNTSHVEVRKNKVSIRKLNIDKLDNPVPKRSENLTINGLLGWDDEITLSIGQTIPLPMQLLGVAYKVRV